MFFQIMYISMFLTIFAWTVDTNLSPQSTVLITLNSNKFVDLRAVIILFKSLSEFYYEELFVRKPMKLKEIKFQM